MQPNAASHPVTPPAETRRKGKFNLNRAQVVDENFIQFVRDELSTLLESRISSDGHSRSLEDPLVSGKRLTRRDALEMFESQLVTRHQDLESRAMRARNEGFYTIGSAGHESNAVVGRLTRHTDMAFLHYRSGAFMAERARKVPGIDFTRDTMLSFAAGRDDPISGGRHKVWGSVPLCVPPQTSTIASHLPKAVGTALLLARAHRAGLTPVIPTDGIVVCSFGDASCNHAVAQTAFNVAAWASHQHLPVPILFVCEDNGIGISVDTPHDWIEHSFGRRHGIRYFRGDGLDLVDAYEAAFDAVELCRRRRCPVFLHLKVVRLLGHAGSDAETEYHSWEQIEAAEAKDPLLASARLVVEHGLLTPAEVLDLYERIRDRVRAATAEAVKRPKLSSAEEIMAPLAPYTPDAVAAEARRAPAAAERLRTFGGEDQLPEKLPPRHMAALINLGLHDLLLKYPESILFGEDVAKKGGVYHVTTGLLAKFGPARVFNTLLDETSILGLAIGAGHLGFLPIPEIQYLAYYHNAEDQIRGEAGSLQFFSKDQYRNPMVIRIQGWGYQKGFGGHFHNDNSIAALRDVPGLIVATPARGDDAVKMMRTCMALARVDGRVIAFIEPIALYMTRDLHEPKDAGWSFAYPPPGEHIPLGEPGVYHAENRDLTILTFANGLHMSLRAARTLQEDLGLMARVVDLRWLNPLNEKAIVEHALASRNVLIVDESRRAGGVAEAVLAAIHENCGSDVRARRLNARDTYIPLGPAADCVLPVERDIVTAAQSLMEGKARGNKRAAVLHGEQKTPGNREKQRGRPGAR